MRGKTAEDVKLLELLDPVAEAVGYEIVRLRLMGGEHARRLQIFGERPSDGDMNIEDCARLSRAISDIMDAADPITGEYTLEVSSPGVDRPLTRLRDFAAYEGHEARLELDRLAEGRKRFRGVIVGVEGDQVAIDLDGEADTALIPFSWIIEAKLMLTDGLLKRGAEQRAARLTSDSLTSDSLDSESLDSGSQGPESPSSPVPRVKSASTKSSGAKKSGTKRSNAKRSNAKRPHSENQSTSDQEDFR